MVQIRVLLQICVIKYLIYFKFHNFQILRSKLGFVSLKILVIATDPVLDAHIRGEIVPVAHGVVDKYVLYVRSAHEQFHDRRQKFAFQGHQKVSKFPIINAPT